MQHLTTRNLFTYSRYGTLYLTFFLGMLVLLLVGVPSVHAASLNNPQVIIIVDATSPSCHLVEVRRSYTTHAILSTTHLHCPVGTIYKTASVPLSQAIIAHEPYVVYPTAGSSKAAIDSVEQQLERIKKSKVQSFKAALVQSPTTACGQETIGYVYWSAQYDSISIGVNMTHSIYLTSSIDFYVNPNNCKTVVLFNSGINVTTDTGEKIYASSPPIPAFYWSNDRYSNGTWNVPGTPYLSSHTNYTHTVNASNQPFGLTYQTHLRGTFGWPWYDFWSDIYVD